MVPCARFYRSLNGQHKVIVKDKASAEMVAQTMPFITFSFRMDILRSI
nr:MAG TPA: hypothetical protein [Caudoviricetes sp.]